MYQQQLAQALAESSAAAAARGQATTAATAMAPGDSDMDDDIRRAIELSLKEQAGGHDGAGTGLAGTLLAAPGAAAAAPALPPSLPGSAPPQQQCPRYPFKGLGIPKVAAAFDLDGPRLVLDGQVGGHSSGGAVGAPASIFSSSATAPGRDVSHVAPSRLRQLFPAPVPAMSSHVGNDGGPHLITATEFCDEDDDTHTVQVQVRGHPLVHRECPPIILPTHPPTHPLHFHRTRCTDTNTHARTHTTHMHVHTQTLAHTHSHFHTHAQQCTALRVLYLIFMQAVTRPRQAVCMCAPTAPCLRHLMCVYVCACVCARARGQSIDLAADDEEEQQMQLAVAASLAEYQQQQVGGGRGAGWGVHEGQSCSRPGGIMRGRANMKYSLGSPALP